MATAPLRDAPPWTAPATAPGLREPLALAANKASDGRAPTARSDLPVRHERLVGDGSGAAAGISVIGSKTRTVAPYLRAASNRCASEAAAR